MPTTEALVGCVRSPLAMLMLVQAQRRELGKSGTVTTKRLFDWFMKVNWSADTEKVTMSFLDSHEQHGYRALSSGGCTPLGN